MSYRRYKIFKGFLLLTILLLALISCEKEVFTGLVENSITEYGKVFVSSNPRGYKLYIDNKYMNVTTPDSITFVNEGNHKLTLKHEIFSDSSMNIVVKKSSPISLNIDMTKSSRFYAKVFCSSNPPGAKIFFNDVFTNFVTPATITKIYPGEFEIKFSKSQCREDSILIKLKGDQYTEIYRQLTDTTRGVDYRTINTNPMSDVTTKVVVDKFNNKWVGSKDIGLLKFDGKKWYSYVNALSSNNITTLLIDSRDRLWVGTTLGLSVFDGINWQHYDDRLPARTVTAIKEDLTGNIWIGTVGGLVKYNNSTFQTLTKSNSNLPDNNITCIAFSKFNELWIGTATAGVIRNTNNSWQIQSQLLDYIVGATVSKLVADLTFDKNGNIWAYMLGSPGDGTSSALIKNNGLTWRVFSLPNQFPVQINSFNVDADNNIWISAVEGLVKYNETMAIKYFNTFDFGFYSKHCSSSIVDKNGDVWVTTMGGGILKLKKPYL